MANIISRLNDCVSRARKHHAADGAFVAALNLANCLWFCMTAEAREKAKRWTQFDEWLRTIETHVDWE